MFATQAIIRQSVIEGLDDSKKWDRLMSPDKTEGFEFGTWSLFPAKSHLIKGQEGVRIKVGNNDYVRYELSDETKRNCLAYLDSWTFVSTKKSQGYVSPDKTEGYKTKYYQKLRRLLESPDVFFYLS